MARDTRRQGQATRKPAGTSVNLPGWAWLVAGIAIGLLAAFLVYLSNLPDDGADTATPAVPQDTAERGTASVPAEPPPEPEPSRFSFFEALPKMTIEVPVDPLPQSGGKNVAEPSRPEQSPPQATGDVATAAYVLQVGSFRDRGQANSLKARLALLGVESTVESVRVGTRDVWHRVRTTPYRDLDSVRHVQRKLERNRIAAIVLKLSG